MNATARCLGLGLVALLVAGCGLPSDGGRSEDDVSVPYHLLDDRSDAGVGDGGDAHSSTEPLVFWVAEGDRLVPRTAPVTCPVDVEDLLAELSAGPNQRAREQGLATAYPPESRLALVAKKGDLVIVDLEFEAQIGADRLPVAVGQVVLTLTSAPGIERVSLLSNGESVQVPLADGALTTAPVTAANYLSLVPPPYRRSTPFQHGAITDDGCSTNR